MRMLAQAYLVSVEQLEQLFEVLLYLHTSAASTSLQPPAVPGACGSANTEGSALPGNAHPSDVSVLFVES